MFSFDQFLNNNSNSKIGAGVAIVYDNKILLVHPANASWKKATCGIPKGRVEPGEEVLDAAIRELYEETGIFVSAEMLDPHPQEVSSEDGRVLIYYVCPILDLQQIGLDSLRIPRDQLQKKEIDWAKFVGPEEAYPITVRSQLIILDRLLRINN